VVPDSIGIAGVDGPIQQTLQIIDRAMTVR
jgi:hypothetical protein